MPNGISHPPQLDESILNLRVVFQIHLKFKGTFCKQTMQNLIRRRILQHLIWFCTVWACPIKWTLHLYGLTWRFGITKIISLITKMTKGLRGIDVILEIKNCYKSCVLKCADPEGVGGRRSGPPLKKSQKYRVS